MDLGLIFRGGIIEKERAKRLYYRYGSLYLQEPSFRFLEVGNTLVIASGRQCDLTAFQQCEVTVLFGTLGACACLHRWSARARALTKTPSSVGL